MLDASELLKRLCVGGTGSRLENAGGREPLRYEPIRSSLEASRDALMRGAGPDRRDIVRRLTRDATEAYAKLADKRADASLTPDEAMALEAVIETDGSRPVLFVQDGTIDVAAPELEGWGGAAAFRPQIERVVASVGRIDSPLIDEGKAGTAFMIAPGVVVTNRHVLEGIAGRKGPLWSYRAPVHVDFAGEYGRSECRRFELGEVLFCGPDMINGLIDFRLMDIAVIRLLEGDSDFPAPLSFQESAEPYREMQGRGLRLVQVIGFPGEPWTAPGTDASRAPAAGHEYASVVQAIFRDTFGYKRWAPGQIRAAPGELPGDTKSWVFSHDASTLAGNSGSVVADLRDNGERVLGIHFGGQAREVNWAHSLAALKQHLPETLGMVWL